MCALKGLIGTDQSNAFVANRIREGEKPVYSPAKDRGYIRMPDGDLKVTRTWS